ncbi:hypothetical protein AADR41_01510 [Streptomyces sp. CLV115]|uniref:hypothetical protein n=1 Tax=Streptomyces sp. CLV115 TaxID=3138502 RepID=UPI00313E44A0
MVLAAAAVAQFVVAPGLAIAAAIFVLAAVVAIGVLPRRRAVTPLPQSTAPTQNQLEGTPS